MATLAPAERGAGRAEACVEVVQPPEPGDGFGRIIISETEAPIPSVNLV